MGKLNEKEFKKHCQECSTNENNFSNLYFLYGNEKYLVKQYVEYLLKKISVDDNDEFNFHKFNFDNNADEIASAINIIPFISDRNIVLVSDIDFDNTNTVQINKLNEIIKSIPETSILIIVQNTVEPKNASSNSFIKSCQKFGITVDFEKKTTDELVTMIIRLSKKNNCILTPKQAQKIIEITSTNLNILNNEVQKLCSYCEGREITDNDISLIITQNSEYKIFQFADLVIKGELQSAFTQLDYLYFMKERPETIMAILSSAYIDMYRVRLGIEKGYKSRELVNFFDYKRKEFRLEKAERNSWRIDIQKLRKMIILIYNADIQIKSMSLDSKIIIETLISNLLIERNRNI